MADKKGQGKADDELGNWRYGPRICPGVVLQCTFERIHGHRKWNMARSASKHRLGPATRKHKWQVQS